MAVIEELQKHVTNQLNVTRFKYLPNSEPFAYKGVNPKRGGAFEETRYRVPLDAFAGMRFAGNVGGEKPSDYARSVHFHNLILQAEKVNGVAFGFDVDPASPGNFEHFLDTVMQNAGQFLLLHVTDPYKARAFDYAVKQGIPVAESAKISGVVNPFVFGKGVLAENVDGYAMLQGIESYRSVRDSNILLIGAGGGASSIALEAVNRLGKGRLVILNRTAEKAHDLGKKLREYKQADIVTGGIDLLAQYVPQSDVIISAVTENPYVTPEVVGASRKDAFFADINYGAGARMAVLAKMQGRTAIDGGPMVYYGVERAAKLAFERAGLVLHDSTLESVKKEAGL